MNVNSSLVTDTSRAVTQASVDAYRDCVSRHIDNDWAAHTPIRVASVPFYEQAPFNTHLVANACVRLLLTHRPAGSDVTAAFVAPALIQSGVYPPAGSAPVILRSPSNLSVKVGDLIHLSVYAASSTPMMYQWQKNAANIAGATGPEFNIPAAALADQAVYRVLVSNSVGTTVSGNAEVSVSV